LRGQWLRRFRWLLPSPPEAQDQVGQDACANVGTKPRVQPILGRKRNGERVTSGSPKPFWVSSQHSHRKRSTFELPCPVLQTDSLEDCHIVLVEEVE
jgi:hypothetical protein